MIGNTLMGLPSQFNVCQTRIEVMILKLHMRTSNDLPIKRVEIPLMLYLALTMKLPVQPNSSDVFNKLSSC